MSIEIGHDIAILIIDSNIPKNNYYFSINIIWQNYIKNNIYEIIIIKHHSKRADVRNYNISF